MSHRRSYSDDKSSMQSTSNSAPLTVFSQQQARSLRSPCSSPPQSRDQSPVRLPFRPKAQSTIFEERPEILSSPILTSDVQNPEGRCQSVAANICSTEVLLSDLSLSKRNEVTEMNILEQGDCSTPTRSISDDSQIFLSLDTVGGLFNEPHSSSVGVSGPSTCSDDSSDEDIDLEQAADKFLSEEFGISLSRLRRPYRIIYAFQQVKNQCVGILEDEGHQFVGSPRNQDSESEPIDGEDASHSTGGNNASSMPSNYFTPSGTKRPNRDTAEPEGLSGPCTLAKTRRHKKPRIGGDFSCPYRKRNPRRFNVRDHPECANKSYEDFSTLKASRSSCGPQVCALKETSLPCRAILPPPDSLRRKAKRPPTLSNNLVLVLDFKKHIRARHCKEEKHICERCNQRYGAYNRLVAHLEQCPNPPANRARMQYTDPEDGFNYKVDNMLAARKPSVQIMEWTTLWNLLFPADTVVLSQEFEPVVEDHDLAYTYKCSQSQIAQRIDALALGPSSEQIRTLVFEEIENLLRCGGSHDQYPTPSSNSSISQMQLRMRQIDNAVVEGGGDLSANPLILDQMVGMYNSEWLGQHTQNDIQDHFGFDGLTELSSTDATRQPLTQYSLPGVPNNQNLVNCFPDLAEPFREMGQRTFGLTHSNSGLDGPQQHPALFRAEAIPFNQNAFLQTTQGHHWVLNNGYPFEADPATGWPDSSGLLEHGDLDDTGC